MRTTSKFRAKRANEHVKSAYGLVNTLAAAIMIAGFVAPMITKGIAEIKIDSAYFLAFGFSVHLVGQLIIWIYMKPEE